MKPRIFLLAVMFAVYAAAGAAADFLPMNRLKLKATNGQFVQKDGELRLSGVTKKQKSTYYMIGEILLPRPLDLRGKMLQFQCTTDTPEAIIVLAVRFYSAGAKETEPAWSFMRWGSFRSYRKFSVQLASNDGYPLSWQPELSTGRKENSITRIKFMVGSTTPDVPVRMAMSDFELLPVPAATRNWKPVPEYATKPAAVRHPVGLIKQDDISRAKVNLEKPENQAIKAGIQTRAKFWMERTPEEIRFLIPEEDAWYKVFCPNCYTQPEFAWRGENVLLPDWKHIRCTKCGMIFPNDKYPENSSYTIRTPHGKVKTIHYYHGKNQISAGENYGPRYHLSGMVNYKKLMFLPYIYDTALLYALTGERAYAERVRDVLVRFGQVYPNYSVKFRATAYETPRGPLGKPQGPPPPFASPNGPYMGGKLCAWKVHEGGVLPLLLNAYCLTHDSGVYSDADKLAVENGICREYKWLITAFGPDRDYSVNAIPTHMTVAALCAAILGDHELMDWVLQGPGGFFAFLEKYYQRDGHWAENTAAYANMANKPLVDLVYILKGYSDAPDYQKPDRYDNLDIFRATPMLKLIFSGMAAGTLPTRALPAFNDSTFNTVQSIPMLETLAALQPTQENREMFGYMAHLFPNSGGSLSIFKRDPDFAAIGQAPEDFTRSILFPGGGWALLRRPETFRDSAVALYFGGYAGGHSHNCTLSYLYCDFGKEVSSDLGYLTWFHPNRLWMITSLAHNLVVVDGKEQQNTRIGVPELFTGSGSVLAARFDAPLAYPGVTREYSRTIFSIPLPEHRQYLADFFTVRGGKEHLWAFHADGETFTAPENLNFRTSRLEAEKATGVEWLKNLRSAAVAPGVYQSRWQFNADLVTTQYFWAGKPMELFCADAPGLRNLATPYLDVKLNMLLARAAGPDNTFASVLETSKEKGQFVQEVSPVSLAAGSCPATVLRVKLRDGGSDLIILRGAGSGEIKLPEYPQISTDAQMAVVRLDAAGKVAKLWCANGSVEADGRRLEAGGAVRGKITAIDAKGKVLTTNLTDFPALPAGNNYLVVPARRDGAYRLIKVMKQGGKVLLQLHPDEVLRLKAGDEFAFCPYAETE